MLNMQSDLNLKFYFNGYFSLNIKFCSNLNNNHNGSGNLKIRNKFSARNSCNLSRKLRMTKNANMMFSLWLFLASFEESILLSCRAREISKPHTVHT